MTYKIKYLPLAVQDLNEIARYLSGFYPKTARRVLKELREKITKLGDTPKMCEVYRLDPAYRRMVVDQYLVFYRVTDENKIVEIHCAARCLESAAVSGINSGSSAVDNASPQKSRVIRPGIFFVVRAALSKPPVFRAGGAKSWPELPLHRRGFWIILLTCIP